MGVIMLHDQIYGGTYHESGIIPNPLAEPTAELEKLQIGELVYNVIGLPTIPDGRVAEPNNIQIWLHCANIWDKDYVKMSEILADTPTLMALISNHNAIDYLARSTDWTEGEDLIPTMTSNIAPRGIASASSVFSADYAAWRAFDKTNIAWSSISGVTGGANQWVRYDFGTPVYVNRAIITPAYAGGNLRVKNYKIQGSNDGTNYDTIYSGFFANDVSSDAPTAVILSTNVAYRFVRCFVDDSYTDVTQIRELQFRSPSIVENETAMTLIEVNEYALNTLLDIPEWNYAITHSPYYNN